MVVRCGKRDDLKLDALYVVHPGAQRYPLADGIEAVPSWAVLAGKDPAAGRRRAAG